MGLGIEAGRRGKAACSTWPCCCSLGFPQLLLQHKHLQYDVTADCGESAGASGGYMQNAAS